MDLHAGNAGQATLVIHTHPLKTDERDIQSRATGQNLAEMIRDAGYDFLLSAPDENLRIFGGDRRISKSELMFYFPQAEEIISIAVVATGGGGGGGGKNVMSTVMSIALVAIAVMAPYAAPLAGTMFAAGTMGGALLSAGIMIGGSFLINAIAPVQTPKMSALSGAASNNASSPTYSLTGVSNRANPFGPIPRIMGTWHKYHPPLGAESFTEQAGDDQYLRMLLVIGYGPVTVSNICIGETPIGEFAGVEYNIRTGLPTDGPLTLYTQDVHEESLSLTLTANNSVIRTSEPDSDELSVDISAYQGLFAYTPQGTRIASSVDFLIDYRPVGTLDAWTVMTGFPITISGNKNSAFRNSYKANVSRGQYDVRVTRLTPDPTGDKTYNKIAWTALRSIVHTPPIDFASLPPLATMELRIKATDQLSGVIDRLNMTVSSHVDVWTGSAWVVQPSSNPAWWYCDVLCGPATKNAAARTSLDIPTFVAWASSCELNDLDFNAVIDSETISADLLRDIASVGRASFAYRNNLYSITFEKPIESAVMLFSHRNSWDFDMSRDYEDFPHALRVQYSDASAGCQQSELIVYSDGFTAATASRYEPLELWGITDDDQVARQARFHLADLSLRPERYSLTTWISFLRCTRGDRVKVSHPAILIGQCSGRITAVTVNVNDQVIAVSVDTTCTMVAGTNYVMTFQLLSGEVLSAPVVNVPGDQTLLSLVTPIEAALSPEGGELFSFGDSVSVTEDCVVTQIEPSSDLTAVITMRPYVAALYDLESQTYEATVPVIVRPPISQPGLPPAPSIVSVLAGEGQAVQSSNGALQQTMWVTWSVPSSSTAVGLFDVHFRITGETSWSMLPAVGGQARAASFPVDGAYSYDVRVRSVSQHGLASSWAQSNANAVDTTAPARPTGLTVHGQLTQNSVSWTNPEDPDLATVEVWVARDSTNKDLATLAAVVPVNNPGELGSWNHGPLASSSSYTYWVRAVDISRNTSGFFPDGAEPVVTATAFAGSTIGEALAAMTDDSTYETVFRVLADAFMVCKPGYPDKPIFTVGQVNGVNALGLSGNAFIDGLLVARMIGAGEITADKIAAGAITADKIAAGEVTAEKLSADIVFTPELEAGSVTAEMLDVATLSAISSNLGAVTAGTLNMGSGKFVIDASGNATVKSALTGARLELSGGKLRVYDSANVLRVEMGVLT
jgi:predicted phage tail protein